VLKLCVLHFMPATVAAGWWRADELSMAWLGSVSSNCLLAWQYALLLPLAVWLQALRHGR